MEERTGVSVTLKNKPEGWRSENEIQQVRLINIRARSKEGPGK